MLVSLKKLKHSLKLFIDNDRILRCNLRINKLSDNYDLTHPILLRNDSLFTELIIKSFHQRLNHIGKETVLNNIRNEYWIIQGRKTVKSILQKCIICKYLQGKFVLPPDLPDLPSFRVHCDHPFENVGIDYAGPLYYIVNSQDKTFGKCYILLITCCVTRAVHLELVENFTAPTLILALGRFIARRGVARIIVSDNFKTFKSDSIKKFISSNNIEWKFILEKAPWWGGFYKRMIGVTKSCLKKVLLRSNLTFIELLTVLCEIENTINSRPLTYVSEEEFYESITPNKLIYGRELHRRCKLPIPEESNCTILQTNYKHSKQLIEHFHQRFVKEYFASLQERDFYNRKRKFNNDNILSIGDIVFIKSEDNIRLN